MNCDVILKQLLLPLPNGQTIKIINSGGAAAAAAALLMYQIG